MINIKIIAKKAIGHACEKKLIFNGNNSDFLAVFVFHEVSDNPSQFILDHCLSSSISTFRTQIEWISENFDIIHPCEILSGKSMGRNQAVITFDDGFAGVFENALPILRDQRVPSIVFLNMQPALERFPLLPAKIAYLSKYSTYFNDFLATKRISKPAFLYASPQLIFEFEDKFGSTDNELILKYQGAFVDMDTLKRWDDSSLVIYGNHLFQHWNVRALSELDLSEQFIMNRAALSQLDNACDFFAFTYGQKGICWNNRDVDFLLSLGAKAVFSSNGRTNSLASSRTLIDRIGLSEQDNTRSLLWFRLRQAVRASYGVVG